MNHPTGDILVIDAHPRANSLSAALAQTYAAESGARVVHLRDLDFDLVFRGEGQDMEPDLLQVRTMIEECAHLVVVSPTWWASVPALLKGFLDRMFQAGWAYKYRKGSPFPAKLLKGRSARVILTSDSPRIWLSLTGNLASRNLRHEVLRFSGFSPVKAQLFCSVRTSTARQRDQWLAQVRATGRKDRRAVDKSSQGSRSHR